MRAYRYEEEEEFRKPFPAVDLRTGVEDSGLEITLSRTANWVILTVVRNNVLSYFGSTVVTKREHLSAGKD